jgi:site-specific DNA-methyltransferase (adenine-specific)
LLRASKGKGYTFNYESVNSSDPTTQVSSVWRIPAVPEREKRHGYHPTQKPLRLVRRALVASTVRGDLVFDPFCGSGTTAVASKKRADDRVVTVQQVDQDVWDEDVAALPPDGPEWVPS